MRGLGRTVRAPGSAVGAAALARVGMVSGLGASAGGRRRGRGETRTGRPQGRVSRCRMGGRVGLLRAQRHLRRGNQLLRLLL